MSQTETILAELRTVQAGVDRARSSTAALDGEAERVASRAAAAGFGMIATGMSQVREALRDFQARLGRIGGLANEASVPATAASEQPTPEQVIATLTNAAEKVNNIHQEIGASIGRVDEIRTLITRVLQGGNPGPMLSMLENLKQIVSLIAQRTGTTRQSLQAAINEARQTGNSGN